jgi:hypothetical protein
MPTGRPGTPVPPAYDVARVDRCEIFAEGVYRDKPYTIEQLDELIRNFDRFRDLLQPVVVLGHEEDQTFLDRTDLPAAGIVERIWRVDGKLFADFAEVPVPIAQLIRSGAYRKVSIEHYDAERPFDAGDGNVYSDLILRRVALLGGEIPQVKSLADLPVPVFSYVDRPLIALRPFHSSRLRNGIAIAFSEVRTMATTKAPTKFADRPAMEKALVDALPSLSDQQLGEVLMMLGIGDSDAEVAAVRGFAEKHKADLAKMKQTPADFVKRFSEARRRRPGLTAREYGVR